MAAALEIANQSASLRSLLVSGRPPPTPTQLAVAISLVIAVLAAAGISVIQSGAAESIWNLDAEGTIPALFTALLLGGAGICAFVASRRDLYGARRSLRLLALLLMLMSVDEALVVHERIEAAVGVDWQALYAPVIIVCGAAWLRVTYVLRSLPRAQILMIMGAFAWAVAQVLEATQWDGDDVKVGAYDQQMFIEEILEMSGSGLFLIALYTVLFVARRQAAEHAEHESAPVS